MFHVALEVIDHVSNPFAQGGVKQIQKYTLHARRTEVQATLHLLAGSIRRPVLIERYQAVHIDMHEGERVIQSLLLKGDDVREAAVGAARRELDRGIVGIHQPEVRQVPGVEKECLCGERVADLLIS